MLIFFSIFNIHFSLCKSLMINVQTMQPSFNFMSLVSMEKICTTIAKDNCLINVTIFVYKSYAFCDTSYR
jgi:hypothetical protein